MTALAFALKDLIMQNSKYGLSWNERLVKTGFPSPISSDWLSHSRHF